MFLFFAVKNTGPFLRHVVDRGESAAELMLVFSAELVPNGACDKSEVTELVLIRAAVTLASEEIKKPMELLPGGSSVLPNTGEKVVFISGRSSSEGLDDSKTPGK